MCEGWWCLGPSSRVDLGVDGEEAGKKRQETDGNGRIRSVASYSMQPDLVEDERRITSACSLVPEYHTRDDSL
jgi:hypothetical protein